MAAINKLWGSNLAGGAAALGIGLGEHQLLKETDTWKNVSGPGQAGGVALGAVIPALATMPVLRQMIMKGRAGSAGNWTRATKPLLGPGRVSTSDWAPKALAATVTPKILATLGLPAFDNAMRATAAVPDAAGSLAGAANSFKTTLDTMNSEFSGQPLMDPRTGKLKLDPQGNKMYASEDDQGIFKNLRNTTKSMKGAVKNTEEGSKQLSSLLNSVQGLSGVLSGAAGGGAGYIAGGLAADALSGSGSTPKDLAKKRRLRAVAQILGIAGGAVGGYQGGKWLAKSQPGKSAAVHQHEGVLNDRRMPRRRGGIPSFGERMLVQPGHHRQRPDPKEEQAVFEAMRRARQDALRGVQVQSGSFNPRETYKRIWHNPRLGPAMKGFGMATQWPMLFMGSDEELDTGPAYHPLSDVVYSPWKTRGALMHELGHAIDFNSSVLGDRVPDNWAARQAKGTLRDAYILSGMVPGMTLYKEHQAWRKGRNALLEGSAAQGRSWEKQVKPEITEATYAKAPALGSYWGGGLGLAAGLGTAFMMPEGTPGRVRGLTAGLMSGLGALSGMGIGGWMRDRQMKKIDTEQRAEYERRLAKHQGRESLTHELAKAAAHRGS